MEARRVRLTAKQPDQAPKGKREEFVKRIEITRRGLLRPGGAFGAVAAGLLPPFAMAQTTPIKVGFVVPLTGPYGVDAQAEVKGAELAVRQFNDDGGLNGRRAEL